MKNEILRFFSGTVAFTACGEFPERLINLASRKGIILFSVSKTDDGLTAKTAAGNYKALRHCARKAGMRLKLKSKHGLPFLILPYKKRPGIPIGICLFIFTVFLLSRFIWVVEYPNVNDDLRNKIISEADALGVRPGARRSTLDGSALSNILELNVEELSWATINIFGSYASIDVREYERFVNTIDSKEPCNVIASKGGIITQVRSDYGDICVNVGDAVDKGEILIGGVVEDAQGMVSMVHASGTVLARTDRRFIQTVPLFQTDSLETGRVVKIRRFTLFGVEIPLYIGKLPDGTFNKERTERTLRIGNITLPATIINETWRETADINHFISTDEALGRAREMIDTEIKHLGDITVISKNEFIENGTDSVTLTVDISAVENIAQESPIKFN